MRKNNRKSKSSSQAFQKQFNRRKTEFKNPKREINSKAVSITLIGVDTDGKFKQERISIPKWALMP